MRMKTWVVVAGLLALSGTILLIPAGVLANGAPVKIVLGYQNGLSNWGPRGAAGVADITVGEGIVRVTAVGLPRLDGQTFEGWLINTRSGDKFSTGRFDPEADGAVRYERTFDHIPDQYYDLFLVSVVARSQQPAEPTAQVSIAGYFPVLKLAEPGGQPAELPYTGAEFGALPLAVTLLLGGVLGFGLRSALGRRGRLT